MKPWDEEWHAVQSSDVMTGGWKIRNKDLAPRCALIGAYGDDEALAKFVSAAPKMARSLLAQGRMDGGEWHTEVCWEYSSECMATCREAREALKAAGVPLDAP